MYVNTRLLRANSGATLAAATELVVGAVAHIRERHGIEIGAGVQVGGDFLAIGVSSRFASLADLEAFRAALAEDDDFAEALARSGEVLAPVVDDTIWKVRVEGGEPDAFMTVSSADMDLASVAEAMRFAEDVATTVSEIGGRPTGLATAMTGRRSRLVWSANAPSMAVVEETNDRLEASPDYLDLYKRSEGVMVPNTLEQTIWHVVG